MIYPIHLHLRDAYNTEFEMETKLYLEYIPREYENISFNGVEYEVEKILYNIVTEERMEVLTNINLYCTKIEL